MKNHHFENRDRLIENQKLYDKENRDKINTRLNEYYKNRKDSDLFLKLTCNQRSRTTKAFKAQNVRKANKTFDLLDCWMNLLDEEEMKKCFNWINLRPMYVKEIIIKGDKIDMRL